MMTITRTLLFVIAVASACGGKVGIGTDASPKAAELVKPILEAARAVKKSEPSGGPASWKKEELLYALFKNRSAAADEAVVVLLDYYLGEAPGVDLMHNVTVRGKRTLPYLRKYREKPARIPAGDYADVRLDQDVRKMTVEMVLDAVEKGRVLGED